MALDRNGEFGNVDNLYWFIFWTIFITLLAIVVWFFVIRPLIISKSVKFLKKYSKNPKSKTGILKVLINFGVIPFTVAVAAGLIVFFDIWDNQLVRGTSTFGLISLALIGIIQTQIGAGFLSGVEVMLLGAFDEEDDVGVTNEWGIFKRGIVKHIGTHATKFRKTNNLEFSIPNHEILRAIDITNYSRCQFYFETIPIVPLAEEMMIRANNIINQLIQRKTVKDLLKLDGTKYGWWRNECNSGKDVTPLQWARIINPGMDYDADVPSIKIPVLNTMGANDVRAFVRSQIDGQTPFLPAIEKPVVEIIQAKKPKRIRKQIQLPPVPKPTGPPVQFGSTQNKSLLKGEPQ